MLLDAGEEEGVMNVLSYLLGHGARRRREAIVRSEIVEGLRGRSFWGLRVEHADWGRVVLASISYHGIDEAADSQLALSDRAPASDEAAIDVGQRLGRLVLMHMGPGPWRK